MSDRAFTWLVLLGFGGAFTGVYVLGCRFWPFKSCRRCGGTAKLRSPTGSGFRRCPSCAKTGRRYRAGAYVWRKWRDTPP